MTEKLARIGRVRRLKFCRELDLSGEIASSELAYLKEHCFTPACRTHGKSDQIDKCHILDLFRQEVLQGARSVAPAEILRKLGEGRRYTPKDEDSGQREIRKAIHNNNAAAKAWYDSNTDNKI